jgi:dTDP-4-dehydrorhamnose reductase
LIVNAEASFRRDVEFCYVAGEEGRLKIAITGAAGRFGHGLQMALEPKHAVFPVRHADVDTTKADDVVRVLAGINPDVVIHAAALPDIDYCETHPEETQKVNVEGTRNVMRAAAQFGAGLVHISTDAVFDGAKEAPYVERDPTNPISVYGRSKLAAEQVVKEYEKHWIFRVSVLFGPGKENFVSKAIQQVRAGMVHKVASDQLGSATYTLDAGEKILEVVEAKAYGLYHLCNSGPCTRLDLAKQAVADAGLDPELVQGMPTASMSRPGPRVKYAVMEMAALRDRGFEEPRRWEEALREYVKTYVEGEKQ